MDEWDVSLAREVEHSIKLHDDKPFRERSCRVAPADLDDLCRHLQGLLAAGIIKESRSSYASPIVLARKKSAKLNATGRRWLAALSTYDFTIQYRPGCHNVDADSLSRNVFSEEKGEWQDIV
ncbi:hypothetical protein AOLI_G00113490 [Acnodon oligacanthus]